MASAPLPAIIPAPREPFVDPRTGTISRTWNLFLNQLQRNLGGTIAAIILTADDESASYPNSLVLTPAAGQLERLLDPATFTLGLADTGITAGPYGSATLTLSGTVDAKGRWTSISTHALNSDNVTEGATNLYFTQARARTSVSATAPISYNNVTGVFSLADTAVTPGPYGNATNVATFTVDQKGRLTAAANVAINLGGFSGTGAYTNFTFVNGVCTAAA